MRITAYKQGDVFNKWTLVEFIKEQNRWKASCSCGKIKLVYITHLVNGNSKSCGCTATKLERITDHPLYKVWSAMKDRCKNPNNKRYSSYGGRGIIVCPAWVNSFDTFVTDMGEKPENTSVDRIDCDGNYEPSNCRWATPKEQMNNLRIHKERGYNITELAEKHGLTFAVLQSRLKRGWGMEKALNTPDTRANLDSLIKTNSSGIRGGCLGVKY